MTTLVTEPSTDAPRTVVARRSKGRFQAGLLITLLTLLAVIVALLFALPALWMLFGSLRPGSQVIESVSPLSWRTLIPDVWTLDNYRALFGELRFGQSMANSLLVAFASVIIGLAISVPAAYALTVLRFRGREFVFALLVWMLLVLQRESLAPFYATALLLVINQISPRYRLDWPGKREAAFAAIRAFAERILPSR
jgi:ABC-type glycerol-3-phosphate transport system permease component